MAVIRVIISLTNCHSDYHNYHRLIEDFLPGTCQPTCYLRSQPLLCDQFPRRLVLTTWDPALWLKGGQATKRASGALHGSDGMQLWPMESHKNPVIELSLVGSSNQMSLQLLVGMLFQQRWNRSNMNSSRRPPHTKDSLSTSFPLSPCA